MRPDSRRIHNFRHNKNPTMHPGEDVYDKMWRHSAWIIEASSVDCSHRSLAYPTLAQLRESVEKRVWPQRRGLVVTEARSRCYTLSPLRFVQVFP